MPNVGSEVILPGVIKIEAYEPFNFLASCKLEIVLVIPIFHLLDASIHICKWISLGVVDFLSVILKEFLELSFLDS